ncbi:MAG: acetyl-CoA hydrolase/transferase C-terminal domain-containing protein [Bosea sp. (in: a-proteobacteria)]|uniref:acetyl-CoA hydrolase/transferase C-terminal domain-containing protein n=1 Tax=Bosea sp. (in: a-proteobacteria) TaxID=1871050 RepID=UPI003F7BB2C7
MSSPIFLASRRTDHRQGDASIVVTEYGIADLRGLSLADRLQNLIATAHSKISRNAPPCGDILGISTISAPDQ